MGNWIRVHLDPDGQPSAMMGVHLSAQYWPPSGPPERRQAGWDVVPSGTSIG